MQKEIDKEKRRTCQENQITIIEVPYWWDFKKESLIATIHSHRPDLVSDRGEGNPIPSQESQKDIDEEWNSRDRQREFMDWLGKELGNKKMNEWYHISKKSIVEKGGAPLLSKFRNSTSKLLQYVYPEHSWIFPNKWR